MKTFLSRHSAHFHWLHLGAVYIVLAVVPFCLNHPGAIFFVVLAAASQNIGLLHEHFHRFPPGPRFLVRPLVYGLYWMGALNFSRGRLAHRLHHAYLGTERDPDRWGYLIPARGLGRFTYLFFIGPLRKIFAPVDVETSGLSRLGAGPRRRLEAAFRFHSLGIAMTHVALLAGLGFHYLPWFAGLIAANVFSNLREMAEHSADVFGPRLVNVSFGPLSLLLCSGPGFWFHGTHHRDPKIPYWALPGEAAASGESSIGGYFSFLIRGTMRPRASLHTPALKAT